MQAQSQNARKISHPISTERVKITRSERLDARSPSRGRLAGALIPTTTTLWHLLSASQAHGQGPKASSCEDAAAATPRTKPTRAQYTRLAVHTAGGIQPRRYQARGIQDDTHTHTQTVMPYLSRRVEHQPRPGPGDVRSSRDCCANLRQLFSSCMSHVAWIHS